MFFLESCLFIICYINIDPLLMVRFPYSFQLVLTDTFSLKWSEFCFEKHRKRKVHVIQDTTCKLTIASHSFTHSLCVGFTLHLMCFLIPSHLTVILAGSIPKFIPLDFAINRSPKTHCYSIFLFSVPPPKKSSTKTSPHFAFTNFLRCTIQIY